MSVCFFANYVKYLRFYPTFSQGKSLENFQIHRNQFFSLKCINLLTLSCYYEKKVDYKIQLTLECDSSTGWTLHTDVCG